MTQKELGYRCGKNSAWVSRYENRYFNADLDTLARMCVAFDQNLFAALNVKEDVTLAAKTEETVIASYRAIERPGARAMAVSLLRELAGAAPVSAGRALVVPPTRHHAKGVGSKPGARKTPSM